MITIKHKDENDGSVVLMTNGNVFLDDKLEFFKRFLAAIGHPFDEGSDLILLEKYEMAWTDEEIATLKKQAVEQYLEGVAEAKEESENCHINQDTPDDTSKENYMDEDIPF